MSLKSVEVAIGLVFYQSKLLLGWRSAKQHQGNKYEFPGGKIEKGENAQDACRREVLEEVGIDLPHWHFVDLIEHQYDDLIVKLHVFSSQIDLSQLDKIQKPWAWHKREQLSDLNFPAANQAILQRLLWPRLIKISSDWHKLQHVENDRWLYLRCDHSQQDELLEKLQSVGEGLLSRLILNINIWSRLSQVQQSQVAAVHFKQQQLMQLHSKDLPRHVRSLAACHDEASILHANHIGVDAISLSPVLSTPTHPEQQGLGWELFSQLAVKTQIPVFALGGMHPKNDVLAQQHHAYGVAGIRNF